MCVSIAISSDVKSRKYYARSSIYCNHIHAYVAYTTSFMPLNQYAYIFRFGVQMDLLHYTRIIYLLGYSIHTYIDIRYILYSVAN